MNRDVFYKTLEGIENGTITELSKDDAYALLDGSRVYRTPLSTLALDTARAAVLVDPPRGYRMTLEVRPDGYRVSVIKKGKQLPAESGDDTP